jgi:glycosyltransferase involved in cell wall biosynthesis
VVFQNLPKEVVHFELGKDETKFPLDKIGTLLTLPRNLRTDVALLPSYFHWSLALNAATRLVGGRVVMMNETHAGTARARGLKAIFKRQVVSRFHAGFVGGAPHRRYFASLGLPTKKIFTGYDAVDNDYFSMNAEKIRGREAEVRKQYDLPKHFFLSLGRFVSKKNLNTLIKAYCDYLASSPDSQPHLVMVGSGEDETKLRTLCRELGLPTYEKTAFEIGTRKSGIGNEPPGVHFYGFRPIEENPFFYGLADAFILPSLWEEWGLVVNEAMACGLPVIVSQTAGCAEDLVQEGVNGFTFDPRNVQQLADLMLKISAFQPFKLSELGNASREIISHWGCDNFAQNALRAALAAIQ